jgi:hypothetical protein
MVRIIVSNINYPRQEHTNRISNRPQLLKLVKQNEITTLEFHEEDIINYYKKLLTLLKSNTSIHTLYLSNNCSDNECYELLKEMLLFNKSLNKFYFSDSIFHHNKYSWIHEMIKDNTTLTEITLGLTSKIGYNIWKPLISALKDNKTLTYITLRIRGLYTIDGDHIAEILRVNTVLNKIVLSAIEIKNCDEITKALEYNSSIVYLSGHRCLNTQQNLRICERNEHNIRLKTMMLQDL